MDIVTIYFKHFKKCVKQRQRVVALRGSSRSAKTYSVCQWFYYLAKKGVKFELTIVGHSIPFLRDGVYNSFKQIAPNENFIKSPFSVKINNAEILFRSFKDEDDAKSAERDFLYVNECNHIPYEIIQQLVIRTRIMSFFDFNPTKRFWIDEYVNSENILHTTFKDNRFLSAAQIENFEKIKERAERSTASAYDKYLYSVYYLGEYGDLSGNVFSQIEEINDDQYLQSVGNIKLYCLDFGFSQDPIALVELTYKDGKYVAKELLYKNGLNDFKLAEIIVSHAKDNEVIVCDWGSGGDARISNLFDLTGLTLVRAVKGDGSIKNGVELINSKYFLLHGENINREFKGYEFKDGEFSEKDNHCFTGDTLITTSTGKIRIDEIKIGDLVLTSKGFKRVLKTFDNGIKQVNKYSMQFDTDLVYLCSTKEHKIKTKFKWKKISLLKSGQTVYQCRDLTEKNITYILKNGISQKGIKGYTLLFMSSIILKLLKVFKFIIKTAILGITILITWNVSKSINIYRSMVNKGLEITKSGLNIFIVKVLSPLKSGINQMTAKSGIVNIAKNHGKIESLKNSLVNNVGMNTRQDTREYLNSVITIAKLKHLDKGENYNARVYDLMVEDCHEYFANGILVHNCIDAVRYGLDYAVRARYFD